VNCGWVMAADAGDTTSLHGEIRQRRHPHGDCTPARTSQDSTGRQQASKGPVCRHLY